jgi:glycosyltransferase involved in cell wall biosynthesis
MRIALIHDWLTGMRGGEKCLDAMCRIWPNAHLYTLIHQPGSVSPAIERMHIRTSLLQRVPGIFNTYRYFLPLMPLAIERLRLADYDLVVSLSHCVAKSARVPSNVPHICYCFTPMRYAWHQRAAYFGRSPIRQLVLAHLRRWDRCTSDRVTHFVAISRAVQQRIRECYGRESSVICPPVDVDFFTPAMLPREDFYLCVSALVPYKRIGLAIMACNRLGRRLVVIGAGPERARLQALAGPTVTLLGWQTDSTIRDHYRRCRALLFPGEEDFGIVPLEAQACATPVIAYQAGGAGETVVPASGSQPGTGVFFQYQTSACLAEAMLRLESGSVLLSEQLARSNAELYCTERFTAQIKQLVEARRGLRSPSNRYAA